MASDKITLHVISPSIPAPGRFTLHGQPLSDTVAQIKARITQSLPGRPAPAQQRLIYRGKPLTDDRASLASVLGPIDVSIQVLIIYHLPCYVDLTAPILGIPMLNPPCPASSSNSHHTLLNAKRSKCTIALEPIRFVDRSGASTSNVDTRNSIPRTGASFLERHWTGLSRQIGSYSERARCDVRKMASHSSLKLGPDQYTQRRTPASGCFDRGDGPNAPGQLVPSNFTMD